MKKFHATLYGTSPLIMNSPKCVNPLHPISIKKKVYTSKRKKSDEDLIALSDLEWEAGVYWDDQIGLYIPNECLAATLFNGAKFNKNGKDVQRFCHIINPMAQLDIGEQYSYDKLKGDIRFRDVRSVVVGGKRVMRTRPRFNTWSVSFDILIDDRIDVEAVKLAFENAGELVGLCEMRDRGYGRFRAVLDEVEM